jgi:cytosine/adenosine deaminase-related metal-dependent hydrolase
MTIANAWICQVRNRTVRPLFGDLQIADGRISAIRPKNFQDFLNHPENAPANSFNAGGRVVTLPLVNFHDHLYSRLAKGLAIQGPMGNFQEILENLWWKLDRVLDLDMIEACAHMGAMESLRLGVTTIFDHHASPDAARQSLAALAGVFRQYGLRGVFCFETSDRNGALPAQQGLEENQRFLKTHTDNDFKAMLGLHASFTLADETLQKAAEMIEKFNAGIHIHLCEDKLDTEKSRELYRCSPVERLTRFHLLNPKSLLSHGIHLEEKDYAAISQAGSAIVYNPDSNLNNNVGLPKFSRVPSSIPILTGTDGMHANVARSMKQLFLLYRHQGNDFDAAFQWIQQIYFGQLEFVRRYFPGFPSLQVGDRADLVAWDYVPPTPFSKDNFWGHYIYGILERPVHSVVQAGRFLMKNHRLQIAEENETLLKIYKQGERLFKAFKDA